MAGRKLSFTPVKAQAIVDRLAAGGSLKAAAESAGICFNTFQAWRKRGEKAAPESELRAFFEACRKAEADAEMAMVAALARAARGHDTNEKRRTTKTVVKVKKTKLPDGTVIEEPITLTLVEETEITGHEYDWRAAESWLKRRRREEWGDSLTHDPNEHTPGHEEIREVVVERSAPQEVSSGSEPLAD